LRKALAERTDNQRKPAAQMAGTNCESRNDMSEVARPQRFTGEHARPADAQW
jgi:hypothetical protein